MQSSKAVYSLTKPSHELDVYSVFYLNEVCGKYPGFTIMIKPDKEFHECKIFNSFGELVTSGASSDISTAVTGATQGLLAYESRQSVNILKGYVGNEQSGN